jgi:ribosomal protein S19E (S16A)
LIYLQMNAPGTVTLGRNLTGEGHRLLDEVASAVRPQAEELYAGLGKY